MPDVLIARGIMHRNRWLAGIAEREAEGLEDTLPPPARGMQQVSDRSWTCSGGTKSGRWVPGTAPDGKGTFEHLADPKP